MLGGRKTRYLKSIYPLLPMSYNQFIEPFVGGGAVLFSKNMSLGIVISSY